MSMKKGWNRREFVHLMGFSTLTSAGLCSSLLPSNARSSVRFAYVASERDEIHVYAARGAAWTRVQTIGSERPVSLAVARNGRALYAVNEVSMHRGLPMGTVEAFAIGSDGRLTRLNRRELSLSATMPRQAAVSPDGKSLVVAVRGGGAYNVLPISEDGSLDRVSAILKETGVERAGESLPARPEMVVFDKAGRMLSVDGSAGRLSVFAMSGDGMTLHARAAMDAESGARRVAMHPAGRMLYVAHEDSLACYGYDAAAGTILQKRQEISAVDGLRAMAVHPAGGFVYGCHSGRGVAAWRVSAASGELLAMGQQMEDMGRVDAIDISPDGRELVALNRERGSITTAVVDVATGRLTESKEVARVNSPGGLAVIYS